jgi:U3 small nucleolar RNA-associated protein 13
VFELETLSGRLVSGHTDLVLAVDVSPDGRFIASSSKDNTVRIWETTSGSYRCVATLTGHTEAVHAVAWSQGGSQFVVSGSKDKTIKMWDLSFLSAAAKNAKNAKNAKPEGNAFQLEHRSVDSAAYTKKAHEKVINSMAVAPNDRVFATASQDKTIKLWDAATGELQATLAGHRRGVWHVEFSPVERCLLSASADKTVKLWDIGQGVCVKTFEGHTNSVLRASFLTHGMQVLSTSSDGTLKLWTIKTSECVNTFTAHEDRAWALAVRDEGAEIVTGGGDSLISVWHDCTAADEAAALEVQQQTILRYFISFFVFFVLLFVIFVLCFVGVWCFAFAFGSAHQPWPSPLPPTGSRSCPTACGGRTTRRPSSWPLPSTDPPRSSTSSRSSALVLPTFPP